MLWLPQLCAASQHVCEGLCTALHGCVRSPNDLLISRESFNIPSMFPFIDANAGLLWHARMIPSSSLKQCKACEMLRCQVHWQQANSVNQRHLEWTLNGRRHCLNPALVSWQTVKQSALPLTDGQKGFLLHEICWAHGLISASQTSSEPGRSPLVLGGLLRHSGTASEKGPSEAGIENAFSQEDAPTKGRPLTASKKGHLLTPSLRRGDS